MRLIRRHASTGPNGADFPMRRPLARQRVYCCFSQNDSSPCDAEPPITQGMPTATCPIAAAETQPSATAPTPTWPQKSRLRRAVRALGLQLFDGGERVLADRGELHGVGGLDHLGQAAP